MLFRLLGCKKTRRPLAAQACGALGLQREEYNKSATLLTAWYTILLFVSSPPPISSLVSRTSYESTCGYIVRLNPGSPYIVIFSGYSERSHTISERKKNSTLAEMTVIIVGGDVAFSVEVFAVAIFVVPFQLIMRVPSMQWVVMKKESLRYRWWCGDNEIAALVRN